MGNDRIKIKTQSQLRVNFTVVIDFVCFVFLMEVTRPRKFTLNMEVNEAKLKVRALKRITTQSTLGK